MVREGQGLDESEGLTPGVSPASVPLWDIRQNSLCFLSLGGLGFGLEGAVRSA